MESIYLEGIDYNIFSGKLNSDAVDLDFNNSLLQKFIYSKSSFKWDVESLDLKQYCKSSAKKTEEKNPISNLASRESASNNNNYGEDYFANITEEISSTKDRALVNSSSSIKSSNNAKNIGSAPKAAEPLLENINSYINAKAANVTIISNNADASAAKEDKSKKLYIYNEMKFLEKMNKLKTETKIKVDFSSQNFNVNRQKNKAAGVISNSNSIGFPNIYDKLKAEDILNINFFRNNTNNANNTNTNSVVINIPTKQAYSYNLNSINNIKEEEIKIKETNSGRL